MPQINMAIPTNNPATCTCSMGVYTIRTITKPSAILPIIPQVSRARPRIQLPTTPPTTSSAVHSINTQNASVNSPSGIPTTVQQAMIAAMGTPKNTNTPSPMGAAYNSAERTVSSANLGASNTSTIPNKMNAAVQMIRQI